MTEERTEERIFNLDFPINKWAKYTAECPDGTVSIWTTCMPDYAGPFNIQIEEWDWAACEMVPQVWPFATQGDAEYWLTGIVTTSEWRRCDD